MVSGLKRLLKLSARITACRTSSSSVINFSLPAEDMLRRSKKSTGDVLMAHPYRSSHSRLDSVIQINCPTKLQDETFNMT